MANEREGQGTSSTGFDGTTGGRPADDFNNTRRDEELRTDPLSDEFSTRAGFGSGGTAGFGASEAGMRPGDAGRPGSFGYTGAADTQEGIAPTQEDAGSRAADAVHSGKNRIADQMHRIGERLEERARQLEESGGVQGRAGHIAVRASEALESSADYVRNHEVDEMRDDLENAIRQRPLLSIGIAAGAGFLLARILRD